MYKALVLGRETGPIARVMDIILPTMLASCLTGTRDCTYACLIDDLRSSTFSSGTWKLPLQRSVMKPNHPPSWCGSSWDFGIFNTKPASSRSEVTICSSLRLCSCDLEPTMPSSI